MSLILNQGNEFYDQVKEALGQYFVGAIDRFSNIEGRGADYIAVYSAARIASKEAALQRGSDLPDEEKEDLKNFYLIRQGEDSIMVSKEQVKDLAKLFGFTLTN